MNEKLNNPKTVAIVKALIPLIQQKKTFRQIATFLNKSIGTVHSYFKTLETLGLIKKEGNTKGSFYVVNTAICSDFLRGVEVSETTGRIHNAIVKFKMHKPPDGLKSKKIELVNWSKFRAKYSGITVEWSDTVKAPYFLVHFPITYAKKFEKAKDRIIEQSKEIALAISQDYGMQVDPHPSVSYGEIAFPGDPIAKLVKEFGNFKNDKIKIDESEGEAELEYHGTGDRVFSYADAYSQMPENLVKLLQSAQESNKRIENLMERSTSTERILGSIALISGRNVKAMEVFAKGMREHMKLIKSLQKVVEELRGFARAKKFLEEVR